MTKSIVITGASKGIGRAAADALAEQGWTVTGVARSAPQCFPGEFISADLGDQDQTGALANELAARGNVLGIVNNVGLAKHETIDAVELRVFTAVMDLNVRPALQLTKALLPGMRSARFGRIINVTSLVTRGFAFRASYAAAKAALESLWLANCYFAHNSLEFPVLLGFCDARSGRPFHPFHRYPGSLARTWRCPFHRC
jgi:3-oxoacyl-[acyl-carrier protein] reductase